MRPEPLRSHRWYLRIFAYILDWSVANSWLLYKRDCKILNERVMPLKSFCSEIASTLVRVNKKVCVRRPLSTTPKSFQKSSGQKTSSTDVRYDYWPMPMGTKPQSRRRCVVCPKGVSGFKCSKFNVFLCLKNKQTCFIEYYKQWIFYMWKFLS